MTWFELDIEFTTIDPRVSCGETKVVLVEMVVALV
jgi:hypothetical protein